MPSRNGASRSPTKFRRPSRSSTQKPGPRSSTTRTSPTTPTSCYGPISRSFFTCVTLAIFRYFVSLCSSATAAKNAPKYLDSILAKDTGSNSTASNKRNQPDDNQDDSEQSHPPNKRPRYTRLTRQDLLGPQGAKRLETYLWQTCNIPNFEYVASVIE